MTDIEDQAAQQAAQQLRAALIQLGARSEDVQIETIAGGARVRGQHSAGVQAEFGTRTGPGTRRMGRALEALRLGANL
jgi:hypothetical protein